jgi:hypothetical protein
VNDTEQYFDFIDRLAALSAGGAGQPGRRPAPAAEVASDVPPSYLEIGGKHCEKRINNQPAPGEVFQCEEAHYEVVGCGCRSRFCKQCCVGLGLTLRERLVPILETFNGLLMWTFTVDPKLFPSPAAAFEYVREHRCISSVMRELKRRGLVHSGRYFVVVEWQMGKGDEEGTLMAHWHLLADASYIPFETVCELWNRFRPSWAGPVEGDRPGFGSVRFSAPKFESPKHAARYACKYLIKYPEKGYPEWVLNSSDIHRYSTSRGFWGETPPAESPEADGDGSQVEAVLDDLSREQPVTEPRTTIRERLARCGETTVLMKVAEFLNPDTGEVTCRKQFVWRLDAGLTAVAECLQRSVETGAKRLQEIPRSALAAVAKFKMKPKKAA